MHTHQGHVPAGGPDAGWELVGKLKVARATTAGITSPGGGGGRDVRSGGAFTFINNLQPRVAVSLRGRAWPRLFGEYVIIREGLAR